MLSTYSAQASKLNSFAIEIVPFVIAVLAASNATPLIKLASIITYLIGKDCMINNEKNRAKIINAEGSSWAYQFILV